MRIYNVRFTLRRYYYVAPVFFSRKQLGGRGADPSAQSPFFKDNPSTAPLTATPITLAPHDSFSTTTQPHASSESKAVSQSLYGGRPISHAQSITLPGTSPIGSAISPPGGKIPSSKRVCQSHLLRYDRIDGPVLPIDLVAKYLRRNRRCANLEIPQKKHERSH